MLEGLSGAPLSIDTSKAEVARRALELGVELVNDVAALRGDPALVEVVADANAYVCLMHMQGEPRTMQAAPHYDDVVTDVLAFLEERVAFAVEHGIREERICVDPGIGFGKTPDQNLEICAASTSCARWGGPCWSAFRAKSTLGKVTGDASATQGSLCRLARGRGRGLRAWGGDDPRGTTCARPSRR